MDEPERFVKGHELAFAKQMPKLLFAYRRLYADEKRRMGERKVDYYLRGMFEGAMREYSELDLPESSSPDAWEEAWHAKSQPPMN